MGRSSTSFEPGNIAALKHGSRSPRIQRSKQQAIRSRVRRELKTKSRAWLDRLIRSSGRSTARRSTRRRSATTSTGC